MSDRKICPVISARHSDEITELRETIARLREGRDLLEEKNTLQERRLDDLRDLSGRLLRGDGDDFHDGLAEAGKQMRICMSLSPQPPAPEASEAGEPQPGDGKTCGECELWANGVMISERSRWSECETQSVASCSCLSPEDFRPKGALP